MHYGVNSKLGNLIGKGKNQSNSFKEVFDNYYLALCFFANKILQDRAASEDLVEEVFIKLWERQPDFSAYKNIKALLYISVKNACLSFIAKRKTDLRRQNSLSYQLGQESEDFILNEITRAEVLREVYAELQKLPPQCRKVVKLYFLEGLSYEEIADHLDISISTTRNHKAKAVRMLRKKFGTSLLLFLALSEHI